MASFRFIHAADIHLDSPMAGLLARADLPADTIRNATRRAFEAMVRLALDEDAAFIVIAGDLYDGDWKDFATGQFFNDQMRRFGRPCFLLRGNHDAASQVTRALTLPPNVREFSFRTCETHELPALGVALHGQSFPNRAVPEDLASGYKPARAGWFNIGVLHTSADDPGEKHAVYAPCTKAALALKGYDYWALGHIHARAELASHPHIVFPGNLQGRHVGETGAKGCTLVKVEDGRVAAAEHRAVDVLRWAVLQVDVTGLDVASLTAAVADAADRAVAEADGRPVLARLVLTGDSPLHGTLLGDAERLAAECTEGAAAAGGQLWVEKVSVRTRLAVAPDADRLGQFRHAFEAGLDDPALSARLLEELAELRQKLPAEARPSLDLPGDAGGLRRLAADAWAVAADALARTEAAP